MSTRQNVTDILCIGCQKGSTSWVHSVLNCHPKTWAFPDIEPITSTNKEAHYWDWNHHRGADWYRALMAPPADDLLSMDFTPEYAFLSDADIAECKALNPTARVIYILRDPLARAVSTLRMSMLWNFGKDHKEPLALGPKFYEFVQKTRLSEHGNYARNVVAWRRHYPDMLVLNYEDFHEKRRESVLDLMARLDLDLAGLSADDRQRFEDLMNGRVWESEKFPMDRGVLYFLQGLTWSMRKSADTELGMRFAEGARLLGE